MSLDMTSLSLGQEVDMTVRFGEQERFQCRSCHCYISLSGEMGTCVRCLTTFTRQESGLFKVTGMVR